MRLLCRPRIFFRIPSFCLVIILPPAFRSESRLQAAGGIPAARSRGGAFRFLPSGQIRFDANYTN